MGLCPAARDLQSFICSNPAGTQIFAPYGEVAVARYRLIEKPIHITIFWFEYEHLHLFYVPPGTMGPQ
jgi:hypothetical protein